VAPPAAYGTNTKVNYVRTWNAMAPDADPVHLITRPVSEVRQVTEYLDGLGRSLETVSKQSSPSGKDMVTAKTYDVYGREQYQYLPFASNVATSNDNATDGNLKLDPFQQQASFSSSQYPGETYYYGKTIFESSPLNRTQTSLAPGNSWVGSNRGVSLQYLVNQASDSVRLWTIASAAGSIPTTIAMYSAGTLNKILTTDESGHSVAQYSDMQGKVILKKVQLASSPGTGHGGWLSTYYIYDDLDNLRFVIQPKAIDLLEANGTWNLTSITNLTTELCFRYEYDYRKRMIIKMVPGAGEVWMVYDRRDRLVMTQDANLRAAGKWLITKYDVENRPDSSGLLTDANNRTYHQNFAETSGYYPNTSANFELLSQTYYDDYSWASGAGLSSAIISTYSSNSTYFFTSYNTAPTYAQAIAQYPISRGQMTGLRTKVIGSSSQFLASVSFYDDHGRVVESQSINQTGGKDTSITQYDFVGKVLRNLIRHKKDGVGLNKETHSVLTKMNYDAAGRLLTIYKNIDNAASDQIIVTNTYNELGQGQNKMLGNNLDNLAYAYNIRGWLTSINKQFLSGTTGSYFGMELGYDRQSSIVTTTSYAAAQYNGNITGTVWKSAGDGIARKYDFTYDNLNRLGKAAFTQNTAGSAWDSSYINYSVYGSTASNGYQISYDGNGNVLNMLQMGFKVGGSSVVDALTYNYNPASNKLQQVVDNNNDAASKLGDFHYNAGTKTSTDYAYDVNGNLTADANKGISSLTYNYLNLAQQFTVTSKGTVTYQYDARGTKLTKTTIDNTANPVKTTVTTYIGGFVYMATSPSAGGPVANDTLQFLLTEEGRARWAYHKNLNGNSYYGFEFDFFEKDHLGNTRIVLTQQKDTAFYLASGEAAYRNTESLLFANLSTTAVSRSGASGYPNDVSVTNPNDTVFKVSGTPGGRKVGPSLLLKVMSGDKIDLSVQYYYNSGTTSTPNDSKTDVLASLASGIVNMVSGGKGSLTDLNNTTTSPIYAALNSFLPSNDPNTTGKPKAYLNWILLDDQLKYVSSSPQSGAQVVGIAGSIGTLGNTGIPINKNGFLYIWVSNETPGWDVFFDNLKVVHYNGPELEETHYYPFGLTMTGISSKALKPKLIQNNFKYNGKELQNQEFSDGSGIEEYDFGARMLDPQLGVWHNLDPLADKSRRWSPYNYGADNPIRFIDPDGMEYEAYGTSWNGCGAGDIEVKVKGEPEKANDKPSQPKVRGDKPGKNKPETDKLEKAQELKSGTTNKSDNSKSKSGTVLKQTGETGDKGGKKPTSGSTVTTKSTSEYTLLNSGYGDKLTGSVYTGTVVGEEGSLVTTDASTSNGEPEGTSVTFGGVLTVGYGNDKSVSMGVGAFGYETHISIGMGNGLGQVSAGGSHTANGVISGGDVQFKVGGVTATAIIATGIIMSGGLGALAL